MRNELYAFLATLQKIINGGADEELNATLLQMLRQYDLSSSKGVAIEVDIDELKKNSELPDYVKKILGYFSTATVRFYEVTPEDEKLRIRVDHQAENSAGSDDEFAVGLAGFLQLPKVRFKWEVRLLLRFWFFGERTIPIRIGTEVLLNTMSIDFQASCSGFFRAIERELILNSAFFKKLILQYGEASTNQRFISSSISEVSRLPGIHLDTIDPSPEEKEKLRDELNQLSRFLKDAPDNIKGPFESVRFDLEKCLDENPSEARIFGWIQKEFEKLLQWILDTILSIILSPIMSEMLYKIIINGLLRKHLPVTIGLPKI